MPPSNTPTTPANRPRPPPVFPKVSTGVAWLLFFASLPLLALVVGAGQEWRFGTILRVDALTAITWTLFTLFSGIIHSYARRYMAGDAHINRFFARMLAFTLIVMAMTAANHVTLLAATWLAMGLIMASLIGHVPKWPQAQAAATLARRYFLASTIILTLGTLILARTTGTLEITAILANLDQTPRTAALTATGLLMLAATIQSALLPFHRWLSSSMTAPTPASTLMHAGFVNAGGYLLTRFAPLLSLEILAMGLLVLIGALSAVIGQALLAVQPDVKTKLASSTTAQMGFMMMQCGLGYFSAAIAHLILHGFYKGYLFLDTGSNITRNHPQPQDANPTGPLNATVTLITAAAAGIVFATLTGKGIGLALDSGLILTLVVVLTTIHASQDILQRTTAPLLQLVAAPLVVLFAISVYALMFNLISTMLDGVPMVFAPTEVTALHALAAALFAIAYAAKALGLHRSSKRLYAALLNAAQPDPETITTRKEDYHAT